MAEDQLLHDQAGLDRLAEADVICDQQIRARHAQSADHRFELVVLDHDPRPEGGLERTAVGARHRPPANGIQERVELPRIVDAVGIDLGKVGALDRRRSGLELPDDRELLAGRVVLDADQRHQVLATRRHVATDVCWQFGADHVGYDPPTAADDRKLPGLRCSACRCL